MGKKFINKKQAATFQLIARDSSDPSYDDHTPGADRVFIRVDNNNQYSVDSFFPEENSVADDSDSVFADAVEDGGDSVVGMSGGGGGGGGRLPEHVRKEILELGFPDDGYNYLIHLREIKNAGAGSAFFQNSKAVVEPLPLDVKAYDASRVLVPREVVEETKDDAMYNVAEKSVGVRLQRAIDPEVAALLDADDDDLSRFASDDEDLEEDFVVIANLADEGVEESRKKSDGLGEEELNLSGYSVTGEESGVFDKIEEVKNCEAEGDFSDEKQQRVRRLLDDQFEMLENQEYGSDIDDDDDYYGGPAGEEEENLVERLNHVFKDVPADECKFGDQYIAPADLLLDATQPKEVLESASDLIRKCTEYAEIYEKEDENAKDDVVFVEESSDESEKWDCETILTTYSNLDNHPGKIEAPGGRKKKLSVNVADALSNPDNLISLQGKAKIPSEFLPRGKAVTTVAVNAEVTNKVEPLRRKKHGQETKEEKKLRKTAVKEERSEARRVKKEVKGLYKSETQRAQKAVAVSGPSTIHLM